MLYTLTLERQLLLRTGFCIGLLLTASAAAKTIESYGPFDIHYYEVGEVWSTGNITNRAVWADTEKADLHSAIDEWGRVIKNVNSRQVQLHVFWDEMAANTLGGSASALWGNGTTIWTGSEAAWRDGDTSIQSWDTYITYNQNFSWNFGAGLPSLYQYDFRSVVLHELGHSLGWLGSYDQNYDNFGYGGYGLTRFESFHVDSMGNRPFNGTSGSPENFNETDNPVFFDGPCATALYGEPVPIYAPETYTSGSSLSHLDTETFPDYTMAHAIGSGVTKRILSPLEIAMMDDMGWDVIPEPSTTLMALFICGIAFWIRRRFYD